MLVFPKETVLGLIITSHLFKEDAGDQSFCVSRNLRGRLPSLTSRWFL